MLHCTFDGGGFATYYNIQRADNHVNKVPLSDAILHPSIIHFINVMLSKHVYNKTKHNIRCPNLINVLKPAKSAKFSLIISLIYCLSYIYKVNVFYVHHVHIHFIKSKASLLQII